MSALRPAPDLEKCNRQCMKIFSFFVDSLLLFLIFPSAFCLLSLAALRLNVGYPAIATSEACQGS